ncbi:hypothetical protein RhiTH_008815 [Rhizoctonia solani]
MNLPEHLREPPDFNPLEESRKRKYDGTWRSDNIPEPVPSTKEFKSTRLVDDSRKVTMANNNIFVWVGHSKYLYAEIESDDDRIQEIVSVAFSLNRVRITVSFDGKLEEAQMWEVDAPMRPDALLETREQKDIRVKDRVRGPAPDKSIRLPEKKESESAQRIGSTSGRKRQAGKRIGKAGKRIGRAAKKNGGSKCIVSRIKQLAIVVLATLSSSPETRAPPSTLSTAHCRRCCV